MGYAPRVWVAPCPVCAGICGGPRLRHRWRWRTMRAWLRLECPCGVAGAFVPIPAEVRTESALWNAAASGWRLVAGGPSSDPPREGRLPRGGTSVMAAPSSLVTSGGGFFRSRRT